MTKKAKKTKNANHSNELQMISNESKQIQMNANELKSVHQMTIF